MTPPDLAFWGRLLAVLAVEITLIVGLAAALTTRLRSASHRRTAWLASLWAVAFVVAGEVAGVRSFVATPSATTTEPRVVITRVLDLADPVSSTPAESATKDLGEVPVQGTWWPGIVWLGGAFLVAAFQMVGHGILESRHRRATPPDPELVAAARRHAERLGLRTVTLRIWPKLRGPIAFGLWRRVVALPPDFSRRFEPAQRDAILLHEMAHLAARDPLAQAFAGFVGALVWWHPAVGWARRRLQVEMEATADNASTLVPGGGAALAESLVQLGREWTTPLPARGLGVVGASSSSQLTQRVRSLLTATPGWRRPTASARGLGILAAGLFGIGLATTAWPGSDGPPLTHRLLAFAEGASDAGPEDPEEAAAPATAPATNPGIDPRSSTSPISNPNPFAAGQGEKDPGIHRLREKLDALILPSVYFKDASLRDVAKSLQRLTEIHDPARIASASGALPPAAPSEPSVPHAKDPIVTLEIKFLEIAEADGNPGDLGLDWLFGQTSAPVEALPIKTPTEDDPGAASPGASNFRLEHGRLENQTAILSPAQLKALLPRLEARGGVTVLAAPRVTAASGQQAQVQVQESRTIVTQAKATDGEGTNSAGIQYQTEVMTFGPSVDVVATRTNAAWNLRVDGRVSEFVGYDDPKEFPLEARYEDGRKISGQTPLPRLRVREMAGQGLVRDGQTLLLRGPVAVRIQKTKGGWFRASRTEVKPVRLYVLVTPVPRG